METQHGDVSGFLGAIFLAFSTLGELFDVTIVWFDNHSGAVVAICSIVGLYLSHRSLKQRNELIRNRKGVDPS